jgi:hypothetical protein
MGDMNFSPPLSQLYSSAWRRMMRYDLIKRPLPPSSDTVVIFAFEITPVPLGLKT